MDSFDSAQNFNSKRIQAKGWFLTYPRCDLEKERVLPFLEEIGEIKDYVIAKEFHEDGTPHLHVFVSYVRKITLTPRKFDLGTIHGNYQVSKSWNAVKRYCKKGGDFIANFDTDSAMAKQGKRNLRLYTDNLKDLIAEGLIHPSQLSRVIDGRKIYESMFKDKEEIIDIEKKRHFWWYGESNAGKSYKLRQLRKLDPSNWFQIPPNNDWKGYNNEKYLYFDEFKGQVTIQALNTICDGGSKMNTKGGTVVLRQDVVVYILSNYQIDGCYTVNCDTLHNRFNQEEIVRNY